MKDKKETRPRKDILDLKSAIVLLDNLLDEGYAEFAQLEVEYMILQELEPKTSNVNGLNKKANRVFDAWFDKVTKILSFNLTYHQNYFHFTKPRNLVQNMPWSFVDFMKNFESHLFALEEVLISLMEEKNLTIRQEIAKKELQDELLYKITYSDHSREIKLNGITIARPDFESENDRFFNYLYNNPNRSVTKTEIEKAIQQTLKKSSSDILKDLGFTNNIRKIFFPGVTKMKVKFNNPISKEYAYENELPDINLNEIKGSKGVKREIKRNKGKKRR